MELNHGRASICPLKNLLRSPTTHFESFPQKSPRRIPPSHRIAAPFVSDNRKFAADQRKVGSPSLGKEVVSPNVFSECDGVRIAKNVLMMAEQIK